MKTIEGAKFELGTQASPSSSITPLSSEDDPHWTAILTLAPFATYVLGPRYRHDIYVLRGKVRDGDVLLEAHAFASRYDGTLLRADAQGAQLFLYREASTEPGKPVVQHADMRRWHRGHNPGMRVAVLSTHGHRLSLVAWQPGTRARDHEHPNGEEILVLNGELRSGDLRYPAGAWVRLHPGARHEPYADVPTVILLRNGHLQSASAKRHETGTMIPA